MNFFKIVRPSVLVAAMVVSVVASADTNRGGVSNGSFGDASLRSNTTTIASNQRVTLLTSERESYAMFWAALVLMGAIAIRRKSK